MFKSGSTENLITKTRTVVDNEELALSYLRERGVAVQNFIRDIKWEATHGARIKAVMFDHEVTHYFEADRFNGGHWGSIFPVNGSADDIVYFKTFDCFVAYALAMFVPK